MPAERDEKGRLLPGHSVGAATRQKPGDPALPGAGRPVDIAKRLRERLQKGDTIDEILEIFEAQLKSADPAFWRMWLDREWPALQRLDAVQRVTVDRAPSADEVADSFSSLNGALAAGPSPGETEQ